MHQSKSAPRRVLILSASMGAGHDGVAVELARRLGVAGVEAEVADVLALLPLRLGAALRRWYGWMMRTAPWMYALIYRIFFTHGRAMPASPLTVLAAARLRRLLLRRPADEVVSTFHLSAQAAGHLRGRGRLPVPSTVLLTDFAAHRLWLHPGNDRYLCSDPGTAADVTARTGRPAVCHAPVVRSEFRRGHGRREASARTLTDSTRLAGGEANQTTIVLISAGSWGVGEVEQTARVLAGRYRPVILCGRNERLRRSLRSVPALGWRDDIPALMAGAYALVDNAAGLTCREAFAAGLPVISYRPIPGHGREGARAMARAGLSLYARGPGELLAALDRLAEGTERGRLTRRAAELFAAPSVEDLLIRP
jgi:UDP-N-acetylglucosamine:LPS N-acetylglucosamine transferase